MREDADALDDLDPHSEESKTRMQRFVSRTSRFFREPEFIKQIAINVSATAIIGLLTKLLGL